MASVVAGREKQIVTHRDKGLHINRYSAPSHFSQEIIEECSQSREFVTKSGEVKIYRCYRWTCKSVFCKEKWSHKQFIILDEAHQISPFNYRGVIKPPKSMPRVAKLTEMHHWMETMRQWLKRHKGEHFDMELFPDSHKDQPLHWNFVLRSSLLAEQHFRKIMQRLKKKGKWHYSCKGIVKWRGWAGYCVGRKQQHLMNLRPVSNKRLILRIGKPLPLTKPDLLFINRFRKNVPQLE